MPGATRSLCLDCRMLGRWLLALVLAVVSLHAPAPAAAHPHVFVDGGVDFIFGPDRALEALRITWLFDEFDTLYTLSAFEIGLNQNGGLAEADRRDLVRKLADWPEDFKGAAHPSVGGESVALGLPTELDAHLLDGRLQMTYTRRLDPPVTPDGRKFEVAFYEATYFYAFSVVREPRFVGPAAACSATVIPFEPDSQSDALRTALAALGREETPDVDNVGALFADKIVVRCDT